MGLGNLLQKIGDNFKAADFEIKPQCCTRKSRHGGVEKD